ncbi:MAG: helix-turn-helix transcriptional regulator [Clostridia bacterium]|nr:helix-turn-helix transcriptional regulator [Clostridia bacterium]
MKEIEIAQLYDNDYSVTVINALKQYWKTIKRFSCIGRPKKYNLLVFLDGCSAEYILKDGRKFIADSGSVVYSPANAEYSVRFYDFKDKNSNTIGINFLLYDKEGEPFVLDNDLKVFNAENSNYKLIFNRMSNLSEANIVCVGKIKSLMYDLIFKISEFYRKDYYNKFSIIEDGINYLESDEEQLLKIDEIAQMCNVSEVYFRKLFKEYSGVSPAKYRTERKIVRAKNYLQQDTMSVAEISDRLGFSDVSYFIKTFKECVGVTPKQYRNIGT